ncbi:heterokaryon incompatibility protein [Seiridium cupressi]
MKENSASIYQPLGNNSLRLLFIKPAHSDEQIECALVTIDQIDEAPEFEAVSYVWGQEKSPIPIICNGVRKTVTQNLANALTKLRPLPNWGSVLTWSKEHRLHSSRNVWRHFARNRNEDQEDKTSLQTAVWIDAICINQEDASERANQVKLMGRIFQRAHTVKIWLRDELSRRGPVPDTSSNSRWTLVQNHNASDHLRYHVDMPIVLSFIAQALRNLQGQPNNLVTLRPINDLQHRNMIYGLPPPSGVEWSILRDFLSNPWFTRVWVVQEVVLARRAVAILGDWHVDWSALGQAASWYTAKGFALPRSLKNPLYSDNDFLPVSDAAILWETQMIPTKRLPLLSLLKDFRLRHATQDIDKLYATLGLAEQSTLSHTNELHMLLQPNYGNSVETVYRDVARFLTIEHGSVLVLAHVDRTPTETPGWPSWVPDWRHVKRSTEIWNALEQEACQADNDEPLSMGIGQDENSLILQGVKADAVRAYGDRLDNYGLGHVTQPSEQQFVMAAWQLVTQRRQTVNRGGDLASWETLQTFLVTLTAGLLCHDGRAVDHDEEFLADAVAWFRVFIGGYIPSNHNKQKPWMKRRRPDPGHFHEAFARACLNRRFFTTREGFVGIGPDSMKEGDEVVILFGAKAPFLVRGVGSRWHLVGECYISGLMSGEGVVRWKTSGQESVLFELC